MSITTLPRHPVLGGGDEAFILHVEDGKVRRLEIKPERHRRAVERLAERGTWDQALVLVERVCGMCSNSHSAAAVVALEQAAGIRATDRAEMIRTMLCELERIHSHLVWIGMIAYTLGLDQVWMWTWKYGEIIPGILERISGNRIHTGMFVPGGVRKNIEDDEIPWIRRTLDGLKPAVELLDSSLIGSPFVRARTRNLGRLSSPQAAIFGVTGPTARASGLDTDTRKDTPYFSYANLSWKTPVLADGDAYSRIEIRILELAESLDILHQCLDRIKPGAIRIAAPSYPAGEGEGHVEAPRGELIHRIRSDGSNKPKEYRIRPPSEVNLPVNEGLCVGLPVEDAAVVLASIDPCFSCVDRMIAVEIESPNRFLTGSDLIRLSLGDSRRISW
jgi:NADH-quinone oxidoreductase subunit D